MRASIVHLLSILLIAVFAIGALPPAEADCSACDDCTLGAPSRNDGPCSQKTLACHMAQGCMSQMQKVPAQISVHAAQENARISFGPASAVAVKLAKISPEIAPPRL